MRGRIDNLVVFRLLILLLLFINEKLESILGERSSARRRMEFLREEKGEVGEYVSVRDAIVHGVDSYV